MLFCSQVFYCSYLAISLNPPIASGSPKYIAISTIVSNAKSYYDAWLLFKNSHVDNHFLLVISEVDNDGVP